MRYRTLSCTLLLLAWWVVGHAASVGTYTQVLATGMVDWTQVTVSASGRAIAEVDEQSICTDNDLLLSRARGKAVANLMAALEAVRIDAGRLAGDVMAADARVESHVAQMAAVSPVVEEIRRENGFVEIEIRMPLLGSFAQLMLPEEIRQIDPIRSVSSTTPSSGDGSPDSDTGAVSGLVVDARGIGAQPAMAPVLVDESGKIIYGAAFISRSNAVQEGTCAYVSTLQDPAGHPRVAPKPLWIKGLRTVPDRPCDIVISNADAARLRGASANLNVLRRCRVIIILD